MMGPVEVFYLGVSLTLAGIVGMLLARFRIAPVLSFIIVGIALKFFQEGPPDYIDLFMDLGLVLIAFEMGREVGEYGFRGGSMFPLLVASLELILAAIIVLPIWRVLGLSAIDALILILVFATSSTVVMYSLLDYYKVSQDIRSSLFSVLILEDLVAITVLALSTTGFSAYWTLSMSLLLLGLAYMLRVLSSRVISDEMAIVFFIGAALLFSGIATFLGTSLALGSFMAGIAASGHPVFRHFDMRSLRTMFLAIFFIGIGYMAPIPSGQVLALAAALGIVATFVRYSVYVLALWVSGRWDLEEAARVGLYAMPISEFTLIVAVEAANVAPVNSLVYLTAVSATVTSTLMSSFLIERADPFVRLVASIVPRGLKRAIDDVALDVLMLRYSPILRFLRLAVVTVALAALIKAGEAMGLPEWALFAVGETAIVYIVLRGVRGIPLERGLVALAALTLFTTLLAVLVFLT